MKLFHTSLIGLSAAASVVGCHGREKTADSSRTDRPDAQPRQWEIRRPAPATATVSQQPLQVAVQPTLVKQGTPPLVYLVETDLVVSVHDLTRNVRLARAIAPARTIVRIDARKGVIFGTERLAPGPLPVDHSYGIYIEPDPSSTIRTETITPSTPRSDEGNK